jgi:hypothetical protein
MSEIAMRIGSSRVWMIAVAVVLGSGCSFVFSEGPPARHGELLAFTCTRSYLPPLLDVPVAVLGAMPLATELSQGKDAGGGPIAVGVGLTATVVATASAVYGVVMARRCRAARDELAVRASSEPVNDRRP